MLCRRRMGSAEKTFIVFDLLFCRPVSLLVRVLLVLIKFFTLPTIVVEFRVISKCSETVGIRVFICSQLKYFYNFKSNQTRGGFLLSGSKSKTEFNVRKLA
jgi:hypothetical protein